MWSRGNDVTHKCPISILIADDDADDRMLIEDAFEENGIPNQIHFVEDGEQLLAFLRREGAFSEYANEPLPRLILLDLNMPKVDGRTALAAIKDDPTLNQIPVIILTTSRADTDISKTYALGVNSFISKPLSFDGLVSIVNAISNYWIDTVALPNVESSNST